MNQNQSKCTFVFAMLHVNKSNLSLTGELNVSPLVFSPSFSLSLSPADHPEVSVRKGMECHEAALGNPKQPLCKYYLTSPIEVQQPAC